MRRNLINGMVLALAAAITLPAAADAQTPRARRAPGMAHPVERLIEQRDALGLTDAQIAQLRAIQADLTQRNEPLLARVEQAREQMRAERPEPTDEQRAELRQRRETMRDSIRQRAEQLTPGEREQMRERMRARMHERHAAGDSAQRPPRRAAEARSPELQQALEQIQANSRTAAQQIQATLTPEQQEKLRASRPQRRGDQPGIRRTPGAERDRMPRGSRRVR